MQWNMMWFANQLGMHWWLGLLFVWSLIWKGLALYRAARKEHKGWFVILLVVNTAGILEILYLLLFAKPTAKKKTSKSS